MTLSTAPILREYQPAKPTQRDYRFPRYVLKWRQKQLLVRLSQQAEQIHLPALEDQQWLVECLKRSPAQLVRMEPVQGETKLKFWADACEQTRKPLYLRIPSTPRLPQKSAWLSWWLKRLLDWSAAALLVLMLSPVLLAIAWLIQRDSSGPILFRQWRVGERGKLFRVLKFRTMVTNAEKLHHQVMGEQAGLHKREDDPRITRVGRWLRKYSLDELPQLFNVLRGQMSLVGPRPWALYDAVRIAPEGQERLNATPGITGAWQVEARSTLLDLDAVNECDLNYLHTWSLWRDLKILLHTIPKVLSGFGAY